MELVYPDKVTKNTKGKKYLCHQGVVKKMLMNLQKMSYSDISSKKEIELFYKQFSMIFLLLWKEYYSTQNIFWDPNSFILIQLLSFLKIDDCIIKNTFATMNFYRYGYTSINIDKDNFYKKIQKCGTSKKVLIPFIINFMDSSHANLLVLDESTKKAYRIEPNYGFEGYIKLYDTAITNRLESFFKDLGYSYSGFLPSSCEKKYHPGFCAFISIARYFYGITFTNEKLKNVIVSFIKSEYNQYCSKKLS